MPVEPVTKQTIAFVDGQNLFHSARQNFGFAYPNYDVLALSKTICFTRGWNLRQVRFYTGMPELVDNPFWHSFWTGKLLAMARQNVFVYSRPLRRHTHIVHLPDGSQHSFIIAEEKGVDVRIALDVIRMAHRHEYDVALIFSQDQDLSEVAEEIRVVAHEQGRWIKVASAFPCGPTARNRRGINKTDWIPVDRATYDACLDPHDYRSMKTLPYPPDD